MQRISSYIPAGTDDRPVSGRVVLTHDQRHLRRKLLPLENGGSVMLDLKDAVLFASGDRLELENGDLIEIVAAPEELFEIRPKNALHLIELAWHLGNRHLPAQIEETRILILRDHVIRQMLEGLGATVSDIVAPFQPVRGAYHSHDHGHSDGHSHDHHHDDDHHHGHDHHHHHGDHDHSGHHHHG
ncbi:urease accessory protein UreE [Martelella sp. HB161492]|uniref:urease accessory protein UreE n=1 Tax=Martelella sp. HB161492 TaxID=2720726 RepID=UPI00158FE5F5|nr:urease accessory protein UreE [Martelella sp. HB161492]